MTGKIEVTILNQPFTFVAEDHERIKKVARFVDEERIKRVARFVDEEIRGVERDFGIVNTMNAVIMAMMKIADDYISMQERFELVADRTQRLLQKVENIEIPCGVRDK